MNGPEATSIVHALLATGTSVVAAGVQASPERVPGSAVSWVDPDPQLTFALSQLTSESGLWDVLHGAFLAVSRRLGAYGTHLVAYDPTADRLTTMALAIDGELREPGADFEHSIRASGTACFEILKDRRTPRLFDPETESALFWPGTLEHHRQHGSCTVYAVPVHFGDRFAGFVGLSFLRPFRFAPEDTEFVLAQARQAALAMELIRLADIELQSAVLREQQQAAGARAQELAKANQALRLSLDSLASAPRLDAFLSQVLRVAAAQAGIELAHLWVHDAAGRVRLRLGYCRGSVFDPDSCGDLPLARHYREGFLVPEGLIAGEPIHERSQHFVADLFENRFIAEIIGEEGLDFYRTLGVQTEINVPLRFGGRCVGHLAVYLAPGREVRDALVELIQALGHQATLAMELTRLAILSEQAAVAREQALAQQAQLAERELRAAEAAKAKAAMQAGIDALSGLTTMAEFIPKILRIVVDVFGVTSAGYFEQPIDLIYLRYWLHEERVLGPAELPGLAGTDLDLMPRLAGGFRVPKGHLGVDAKYRTHPSVVHHATATASPELHAFARRMGWDWELNVPLVVGGVAEGALTLFRPEAAPFSEADISLAETLAKQVAMALKITRIADHEREIQVANELAAATQNRLDALQRANNALQTTIDSLSQLESLDLLMPRVLSLVSKAFNAIAAGYFEHPEETIHLRFWMQDGEMRAPTALRGLTTANRLQAERLAAGFTVPTAYLGTDPRHRDGPTILHHETSHVAPELRAFCLSLGWYEELNIPLFANHCTDAAITLYRPQGHPFTPAEMSLGETLARQISLARQVTRASGFEREAAVAHAREQAALARSAELERASDALQKTIDAVSRLHSLDDLIPEILRITAAALGATSAGYFEHPEATIFLRYWYLDGTILGPLELRSPGHEEHHRMLHWMADGFQVPERYLGADVRQRTRPSILHHTTATASPDLHAFACRMGWHWEINAPLVVAGMAQGALTLYRPDSHPFSDADIALVETVTKQLALAMKISHLAEQEREISLMRAQERAAQARAREFRLANEALQRSTAQLVSAGNLTQFLDGVLLESIRAVGAVSGAVFVHLPAPDSLQMIALDLHGAVVDIANDPAALMWRAPLPAAGHGGWQVLRRDRELWWADYGQADEPDWPGVAAWHRQHGHRRCVCMPMIHGLSVIGFLGLAFDASQKADPDAGRLELGRVLAHQATLAVRITELSNEARRGAVLEERARLAGEIHDSIAQSFIGLRMQLQAAHARGGDMKEAIGKAMKLASLGLHETRRAVKALRPWQLQGRRFDDAVSDMAREVLGEQMPLSLHTSGEWQPLSPEVEGQLFRIVQEILNNIAKHAAARRVRIELSVSGDDRSVLVSDDGCGFDIAAGESGEGFGLLGMRQRAASIGAELVVVSRPGAGTQVFLSLPAERSD